MKKIRDFIYDYNDIFVALLIIAVAAIVIVWRVNSIMDYPNYVAEKGGNNAPTQSAQVNLDDVDLTPGQVDEGLNANPEDTSPEDGEEPAEGSETAETPATSETPKPSGTFEVPKGSSADKVGTLLVQAGYISSKEEFMSAISGKETRIQAGKFTIPEGATAAQIADIITK